MNTLTLTKLRRRLQESVIRQRYATLRAISGSTRYKILVMLHYQPEGLTVTEMARTLNSTLSRISHQMRILRRYKIVKSTPRRREVVYRLRGFEQLDSFLRP